MPRGRSNLEKLNRDDGPKKYDPDAVPSGYDPMVWRLSRKFQDLAVARGLTLRANIFIIYQRMDYYLELSGLGKSDDSEVFAGEMLEYYWDSEWTSEFSPVDELFELGMWGEIHSVISQRRESRRLAALADEIKAAKTGESAPDFPDRESNPPKPSRHKLGGPSRVGDVTDIPPRMRELVEEFKRTQEDG